MISPLSRQNGTVSRRPVFRCNIFDRLKERSFLSTVCLETIFENEIWQSVNFTTFAFGNNVCRSAPRFPRAEIELDTIRDKRRRCLSRAIEPFVRRLGAADVRRTSRAENGYVGPRWYLARALIEGTLVFAIPTSFRPRRPRESNRGTIK